MRFWFSGPRMLGGLVRPGVSFGPENLRAHRVPATQRELARKAVRRLAKESGMEVPPDAAIDEWLNAEVARLRRPRWSALSIAWLLFKCAIAVPLTAFAIFNFWLIVLLLQQMR
jgi:hypothetical protein